MLFNILKDIVVTDIGVDLGVINLCFLGKQRQKLQKPGLEHHMIRNICTFNQVQKGLTVGDGQRQTGTRLVKGKQIMARKIFQGEMDIKFLHVVVAAIVVSGFNGNEIDVAFL